MAYDVENFEVGYVMRNTPVPVGFWRGVNHSQNGYFRKSFVDELAHSRGQDPFLFRRGLLAKGPRSLAVLDEAARRANWGQAPKGISQGIALVECYNSVTAQVVDISVSDTGELVTHRVICVIDAGHIVNLSIVEAQMEGAVVYGLGAVLYGQITLHEGRVQQSNFHDYRVAYERDAAGRDVFPFFWKQILKGVGRGRRARNSAARASCCQRCVRGNGPADTHSAARKS